MEINAACHTMSGLQIAVDRNPDNNEKIIKVCNKQLGQCQEKGSQLISRNNFFNRLYGVAVVILDFCKMKYNVIDSTQKML